MSFPRSPGLVTPCHRGPRPGKTVPRGWALPSRPNSFPFHPAVPSGPCFLPFARVPAGLSRPVHHARHPCPGPPLLPPVGGGPRACGCLSFPSRLGPLCCLPRVPRPGPLAALGFPRACLPFGPALANLHRPPVRFSGPTAPMVHSPSTASLSPHRPALYPGRPLRSRPPRSRSGPCLLPQTRRLHGPPTARAKAPRLDARHCPGAPGPSSPLYVRSRPPTGSGPTVPPCPAHPRASEISPLTRVLWRPPPTRVPAFIQPASPPSTRVAGPDRAFTAFRADLARLGMSHRPPAPARLSRAAYRRCPCAPRADALFPTPYVHMCGPPRPPRPGPCVVPLFSAAARPLSSCPEPRSCWPNPRPSAPEPGRTTKIVPSPWPAAPTPHSGLRLPRCSPRVPPSRYAFSCRRLHGRPVAPRASRFRRPTSPRCLRLPGPGVSALAGPAPRSPGLRAGVVPFVTGLRWVC
ncbi:hypothetical protein PLESTB_000807400 [Pleodorina starrii]|uniref:Uncharacterized protein n=1 Tax=Pleodorina starrii TaxID=330485 RepID=A0A9W6BL80_9CHLO|nr:hypothetical protein PLESTB_000807400 [Pleodorina starrii]